MPFTASHVAAVLPFMRRPVTRLPYVPAALVIGSMIPDVPLFVPFWPSYGVTHSPAGILTVDTAATCVAVVLFHLVFRAPLVELLPRRVGDRLPSTPPVRGVSRLLLVPVAAAVGAATHAFWDTFTHGRSVSVWSPALATRLFGFPAWELLQYASTVGGLVITLWWSLRRLRDLPALPAQRGLRLPSWLRATVLAVLGGGALAGALIWPGHLYDPQTFGSTVFWAGMGLTTVLSCLLAAYCGLFSAVRLVAMLAQPAAASTISGLALPPRSETTASGAPSGPSTP